MKYSFYSPIGSALKCEASVQRSMHSSGELKGALRGPITCSDPVGLWWCLIHESQDLASLGRDLRIMALNKGNSYLPSMRSVSYLSCMSLNICIHSRSYSSKSRYKHYASRSLLPCTFTLCQ